MTESKSKFMQYKSLFGDASKCCNDKERIEETLDPELTIDRALDTYLKKAKI